MDYYKCCAGTHCIRLTPDEVDQHFDPFDPLDQDLPSHLHHAGHRFIKESTYEWLVAHVGEPYQGWQSMNGGKIISFEDKDKAMLFKLTYQGAS